MSAGTGVVKMAQVFTNGKTVEFSYLDLLQLLLDDIESDSCMPSQERMSAKATVIALANLLAPYSA